MSLEMPTTESDLSALRALFVELFDRANEAVLAEGLDCDDVILERYVDVRGADGSTFPVVVQWLSDRERFLQDVQVAAEPYHRVNRPVHLSRTERRTPVSGSPGVAAPTLLIVGARVRALAGDGR
jgi:hypothetical protein